QIVDDGMMPDHFIPFRYQGQYADEETELYYNRHRYYDPQLGQYITQDPIGLAGGNPTLYGYVSNPNVWIDPFGLISAPSGLPNTPGIYILTNTGSNQAYVGSSITMFDRVSTTSHAHAQDLLGQNGTVVEFVPVDLGSASSGQQQNNILRHFEQQELDRVEDLGFELLNGPRAEAETKHDRNQGWVEENEARAGERRQC
ncbi:MAG: hypothetical protein FWG67_00150, partial [Defluviitaleaceae bacterium]|nr:hypothetical protein [Defluviitaleaceae bacterium]